MSSASPAGLYVHGIETVGFDEQPGLKTGASVDNWLTVASDWVRRAIQLASSPR